MTLIKKAKFSPRAFAKLYDLYVDRVYQYFLRRLGDRDLSEDLTSMVWEKVLHKIQTLKSDEDHGFAGWLFAIARNELNQHFRQLKNHPLEALPEMLVDESKKPDDLSREASQAQMLRGCLLKLPDQQRETIELKYFAELRNKEIAIILEVSEKTVASNLSRALKTLEGYLKKLQ